MLMGARCYCAKEDVSERQGAKFATGLIVGVVLAGAFNPVDRALYLSIVNSRHVLLRANFKRPFEGIGHVIMQRGLSAGLYYPLYDFWLPITLQALDSHHDIFARVTAGMLTGATSGVVLNGLSVVKYHNWSSTSYKSYSVFKQFFWMYKRGGLGFFTHGIAATLWRDAIFGATYSGSRYALTSWWFVDGEVYDREKQSPTLATISIGIIAGSLGAALSSPMSFARKMHFASPPGESCPTIVDSMRMLWYETKHASSESDIRSMRFMKGLKHNEMRLHIGWGTLRVGLGMSIGEELYDFILKSKCLGKLGFIL